MSRFGILRVVLCTAVCVFCLVIREAGAHTIDVPGTELTIQSGIEAASDGDTIRVAPGVYADNLDFAGKRICVMSAGGSEVTTLMPLLPAEPAVSCTSAEPVGAQLLGFTVTGGPDLGPPLINIGTNSTLLIQYCVFLNNPVDNVVVACNGVGIVIRYNVFSGNGGISCIGVTGGTASILNNTFDGNNRGFFAVVGLASASNNIVANCAEYGAYGAFTELTYNDFWNNDPNYLAGATPGTGSITADPLFTDAAQNDYTLGAGSPCIDAGNPDASFNDPDGSRCDIGGIPIRGYFVPRPAVRDLTIDTLGDNQHVVSRVPKISWTYSDAWNQPQTAAEIEAGTDNEWTVAELWNPAVITGSATSVTYAGGTLTDGTTYYARVRVFNDTLWSEWEVTSFHMNSRPGPCALLFPPHEAILLTCCPTLVVMNSTDADGDPLKYDFFVSLDEEHNDIVAVVYGVPGGYGQTDWTVEGLPGENQLHWWRARASDGYQDGPWSEPRAFWLDGYNDPPGPFGLLSPDDGQTGLEQRPVFQWAPATDPDPGADLDYMVTIADNPGFSGATIADAGGDTTLLWPFLLATQTEYWWQVTADDGRAGISESEVRSFQTNLLCDACIHQTDIDGDGYSTALDLGILIDILFLGGTDPQDPGCAVTRADFDCDGYATSLDLGKMIDYLFIGGEGPCDPCSL